MITEELLRARPSQDELTKEYVDGENGLSVRIGKKWHSWHLRYRTSDGRFKREPIGRWPTLSLAAARAIAAERAKERAMLADPGATRYLTPNWRSILPLLLHAYEFGETEGRQIAWEELSRMAQAADLWNASVPPEERGTEH
jgi:hypothetical protein